MFCKDLKDLAITQLSPNRLPITVESGDTSENKKNFIPIIILNWNGVDDTIECLYSIIKSSKAGFVSVLVDNGSKLADLEKLKYKCSLIYNDVLFLKRKQLLNFQKNSIQNLLGSLTEDTLVFIENDENLGFAKGNNVGIKLAELIDAEWVMLLNNDTVVLENTFYELREFIKRNPSIKAITPQVRYYKPNTRIWNCGGNLTYYGSRKYKFEDMDYSKVPQKGFSEITFITGCALLFNYKETGTLIEKFFFGEEDYEFSLRMRKNGLKMACVYSSIIYHKIRASLNKSSLPLGAIYIHYINRLINTRDYYSIFRWHTTKVMVYLYIPILLMKKKISPIKSFSLIQRINSYIKCNDNVPRSEFMAAVSGD